MKEMGQPDAGDDDALDASSTNMDSHRIALLLGAGFSKWSCGLPLADELFDFAIHLDNQTEARRISRLRQIYDYWRDNNPGSNNEAFVRFAQGPGARLNLVNWYITRRLTEPFVVTGGRRFTWYLNSTFPQSHEGIAKAREFLHLLRDMGEIGVLTTNYDMVVEYALGSRNFNYGLIGEQIGYTPYPWRRPLHLTGNIPLAKLHGSISWNANTKFPDLRGGLTGKCLIVPPIEEKTPDRTLVTQWDLAKRILNNSQTLLVFGFSFNEYDTAIRKFISEHIKNIHTIVLVDVLDHRPRLSPIFGNAALHHVNPLNKGYRDEITKVVAI